MAQTPWNIYDLRIAAKGGTRRGAALHREQEFLRRHFRDSLGYNKMMIDGEEREVIVIDSDDFTMKTLCSLPGEDIRNGAMVFWNNFWWLITSKDEDTEVYTKVVMQQCNYQVKWITDYDEIYEYWCIISDGTKLWLIVSAQRNLRVKIPA